MARDANRPAAPQDSSTARCRFISRTAAARILDSASSPSSLRVDVKRIPRTPPATAEKAASVRLSGSMARPRPPTPANAEACRAAAGSISVASVARKGVPGRASRGRCLSHSSQSTSSKLVPSTVRRATIMSTCRETARRSESAEPSRGRPARGSQARIRRPCSASVSRLASESPVPKSQANTRSQLRRSGTLSGSVRSMSGIGGGGQITHRLVARASASWSAEAGSESRTQLKPSSAKKAKGSPAQSIERGKNGSPATSSTPRMRPADGSAGGPTAAAGCTSGS